MSMRIAFVSDTHFGYPRFEQDAYEQGRAAILDAASKADVLLLGGDIFDHRIPKLETLSEAASILQEALVLLPKNGFHPILGIHGTHERRAKDALNPFAMLARFGLVSDVHNTTVVLDRESPKSGLGKSDVPSESGPTEPPARHSSERVAISGLGGVPDDLVREALSRLSCQPLEGATNLFLFHQTMAEFVPAAKNLASLDDLPGGYDWYLCGHLHGRKEYMGGKLLIPGSTVLTQMKDEETAQKGYYLIDTSSRSSSFVPIKTRPFEVSELSFERAAPASVRLSVQNEISRLLSKDWADKPILKIRLTGSLSHASGELDLSGLDSEKAYLTIDDQLDGGSLAASLAQLKEERMNKATPFELGLSLLRDNAQAAGLDPAKAQEYFERFSQE